METTPQNNKTFDIVSLVENNPLTRFSNKDYESKIIDKIRLNFIENEQQLFVANFYSYLNYDTRKDFVINLDRIWKWLGYTRVDNCKALLVNNFKENTDYKIEKIEKINFPENSGKKTYDETRGRQAEFTLLTVNCFKKLCLKAKTKKADEIHDYYINLEEIMNELVSEESDHLKNQLKIKDELIKSKEDLINKYNGKKIDINDFDKKPMVYLINMNEVIDGENLYRIGNTSDIYTRFKTHSIKLKKDTKHDIIFKNGWEFEHIDIAVDVETLIKRYMRSEKILYKYKDSSSEILKTNNIGILEELITKWSEECREKYTKNKESKVECDLINKKLELLKLQESMLEKAINAGINGDNLLKIFEMNVIMNEPKIIKKIEQKEIKKEIDYTLVKCNRCGHGKTKEEYTINEVSGQLYSNCEECRKKEADKLMLKNKDIRELKEKEYLEKIEKINKIRESLLNGDPVKCTRCKTEKPPREIGINKRSNVLYKICNECRCCTYKETESNDCGKCKHPLDGEINEKTKIMYKTCKVCRDLDKQNDILNKELLKTDINEPIKCTYCPKEFPKTLNAKKDGFYKNCQECRDSRKKYDIKKNIVHKDKILEQKKEYYLENKDRIRSEQKEYYDNNRDKILESKKM